VTAIPDDVQDWIVAGRNDVALFAERGFGIKFHSVQILAAQSVIGRIAAYIFLWWANRAGKTALVAVLHLHHLFYKTGMEPPRDERDYRNRWLPATYRTLHCAPLNRLMLKAHNEMSEILRGMSECQWDEETHTHRPAPLAPFFSLSKERDQAGTDQILLRCENGSRTDFLSTEGGAARLEGDPWRFITWDEVFATEGDPENIRWILDNRLTARAADYDATIVITGTITEDTEHLAKEWITKCEDRSNFDWWGCGCPRSMNPRTSQKAIDRAGRNLSAEDYARSVDGRPGGVKGRRFAGFTLDNAFSHNIPERTGPVEGDGTNYDGRRRVDVGKSPWTYITTCDIAISEADNVISVWRLPANHAFSVPNPIVGVYRKIIPGSRTLLDDDIVLTIEETYLPYGGQIYIDTTDAHGKNVARKLRLAGYPARDFDFHDTAPHGETWKEAGEIALAEILSEQEGPLAFDAQGRHDADGVPLIDRTKPYGSIWIPREWTKHYDQMSVLKPPPDDRKQKKDAAMTVVMLAYVAKRLRPRGAGNGGRFVFYGGR
jgi:hypothetical protein